MALTESHKASGNNNQTMKVGDTVLIHDDIPRITWRFTMIEELITSNKGLTQAANLWTASGQTNRPIVRLYTLEITAGTKSAGVVAEDKENKTTDRIEKKGESKVISTTSERISEAGKRSDDEMGISAPPEDVKD